MNTFPFSSHLITHRCVLSVIALSLSFAAVAQDNEEGNKVVVSGSIQSDILFPQNDDKIGTEDYSEWGLTNSFAEVNITSNELDAGVRFEYLDHPLPGFHKDYAGWGVPFFYVKGHNKNT